MIATTAVGSLVLAGLFLLYAAAALIRHLARHDPRWLESGRRATQTAWLLVSLALVMFLYLIFQNRVEFVAVYRVTRSTLPLAVKISALWGGQTGSLFFWTWLLGGVSFVGACLPWKNADAEKPWLLLFLILPFVSYLLLVLFLENPFARWWMLPGGDTLTRVFSPGAGAVVFYPREGAGLNPLLRHPAMIIHPPMLYLGYVLFALPNAVGMALLVTRRRQAALFETLRVSSLVGWFFLTLGLVLGSRWAYDVLGWGGYWGWDPVEIAGLLPWLSSSALLHLFSLHGKRRNIQAWMLALVLLTFNLVILGSFLTRSGMVASVHAFAESSVGTALLALLTLFTVLSLAIWLWRGRPGLQDGTRSKSPFWRAILLSTAGVFGLVLVVCLVGLAVPIISESLTGQAMLVSARYYRQATLPLWLLLLILAAAAPFYPQRVLITRQTLAAFIPGLAAGLAAALISFWVFSLPWLEMLIVFLCAFFAASSLAVALRDHHDRNLIENRTGTRGGMRISRRAASTVLHAGVFLFALGVLGMEGHQLVGQDSVAVGERVDVPGYSIRLDALEQSTTEEEHLRTTAVLSLFREEPEGTQLIEVLAPYIDEDPGYAQRTAVPGVSSHLIGDIYALLTGIAVGNRPEASLRLLVNPLAGFLWLGGLVMAAGALLFLAPHVFQSTTVKRREATQDAVAGLPPDSWKA